MQLKCNYLLIQKDYIQLYKQEIPMLEIHCSVIKDEKKKISILLNCIHIPSENV